MIKIQANVRGYLTRKQYRATPERSIEKPSSQVNQGIDMEIMAKHEFILIFYFSNFLCNCIKFL